MEYQVYPLRALFQQLDIDDSKGGVEKLVVSMAPVPSHQALWEAPEWTDQQAERLKQLYEEEAQWSRAFEQLELLLRA